MTSTSTPLRHFVSTCTVLTLLAAPTLAQPDYAATAQAALARLIGQGEAALECATASPGQICTASGYAGPCTLQAACDRISTQNDCTDSPIGTFGPYGGGTDDAECCIVFYTKTCGAAEAPALQMQGGRRRLADVVAGGDTEGACEHGASESAAICLQSCGEVGADLGTADGAPSAEPLDLEVDDVELPLIEVVYKGGGRGGGGGGRGGGRSSGRSSRRSSGGSGGYVDSAAQQGAAVGVVLAGIAAALVAVL